MKLLRKCDCVSFPTFGDWLMSCLIVCVFTKHVCMSTCEGWLLLLCCCDWLQTFWLLSVNCNHIPELWNNDGVYVIVYDCAFQSSDVEIDNRCVTTYTQHVYWCYMTMLILNAHMLCVCRQGWDAWVCVWWETVWCASEECDTWQWMTFMCGIHMRLNEHDTSAGYMWISVVFIVVWHNVCSLNNVHMHVVTERICMCMLTFRLLMVTADCCIWLICWRLMCCVHMADDLCWLWLYNDDCGSLRIWVGVLTCVNWINISWLCALQRCVDNYVCT